METTLIALAVMIILWLALFVTGRIYDTLSGNSESTWQEDATAASVVVGITAFAAIVVRLTGLPPAIIFVTYFGLCYYAYQVDGFLEMFYFVFIHGAIIRILIVFQFDRLIRTLLGIAS